MFVKMLLSIRSHRNVANISIIEAASATVVVLNAVPRPATTLGSFSSISVNENCPIALPKCTTVPRNPRIGVIAIANLSKT